MTKRNADNAKRQCAIILAYLQANHSISTIEARRDLDILSPAPRIKELREDGHRIETHWSTEETELGTHRVARYVLFS